MVDMHIPFSSYKIIALRLVIQIRTSSVSISLSERYTQILKFKFKLWKDEGN